LGPMGSSTTNSSISHYRILSRIGAGGMGEVYLAEDTSLERRVALKLLPVEFTKDQDRVRRFIQEAKAASALNHPNIITIHEIGQDRDAHYIATEFIDGSTLRQRLVGEPLSVLDALEVMFQVTSALVAAHEAGIVHRDIKPENVMVRRDGIVKVLDFGLAKLTERSAGEVDEDAATLAKITTDPGAVMGTPQYMSPEQARGQKVDGRTDIFSLGVVLYEMIAGRPPFDGVNALDVIGAILQKEPQPLKSDAGELPTELQRIVSKALRKQRDERYKTARDLHNDLKDLKEEMSFAAKQRRSGQTERKQSVTASVEDAPTAAGTTVPTTSSARIILGEMKRHKLGSGLMLALLLVLITALGYFGFLARRHSAIESIAVLPFVNASGNADIEYLSDGMTETLISSLSQLPNLTVKARSTVFYYKDKEASPKKIGEDLGVQAVLLGRVGQRGNELSLGLELVNTSTQDVIWSEQYNRKQADLVALQSEIARDVSSKLKTKLSGADVAKLTRTHTANPEAYQLYLKGKYYTNQFTKEGLRVGIDSFSQAIVADPNYSLAYSGLAYYYIMQDDWFMSPHESVSKAREAATKALAIDETDTDAHVVMGLVAHWYDWDWVKAEQEFKRALELNPKHVEAHVFYAYLLSALGRHDEALAIARRGLQLDPLSSLTNFSVASALVFNRRWDEAIEHLRKAIELDPNYWLHHSYLGRAYEQKGMMPEAIAAFKRAFEVDSEQSENSAGLGHAYAVSGKKAEAQKMLDDLIKNSAKDIAVSPYNVALIYAGLGDNEKSLEWLERAYSLRSYYLPVYLPTDARLDTLRTDSRFKDLVRRIGLPQVR
jgi:eukaryotic-like serine/threonine-protein kinase